MAEIDVYIREWNSLHRIALKTLQMIEQANAWEYRLTASEFTVADTFYHTIRAIFEDAGNSFNEESQSFQKTDSPMQDIEQSFDRIIRAIRDYSDEQLAERFVFPWGLETTISGAIEQILFHTIGHMAQLRERVGVLIRST